MKPYEISLDSEAFNGLKHDFKSLANTTIYTMLQKDVQDAKIVMTVEIHIEDDYAPDRQITAYAAEREIKVPSFKHKTSASMQIKNEKSGTIDGKDTELVWDNDKCCFVMKPISEPQTSLFDEDDDENFSASEAVDRDSAVVDGYEYEEGEVDG